MAVATVEGETTASVLRVVTRCGQGRERTLSRHVIVMEEDFAARQP